MSLFFSVDVKPSPYTASSSSARRTTPNRPLSGRATSSSSSASSSSIHAATTSSPSRPSYNTNLFTDSSSSSSYKASAKRSSSVTRPVKQSTPPAPAEVPFSGRSSAPLPGVATEAVQKVPVSRKPSSSSSSSSTASKVGSSTVQPSWSTSSLGYAPRESSIPARPPREPVAEIKRYSLSEDEEQKYGDRFPPGYRKLDLLGRGGFALVWSGLTEDGELVAVKQVSKVGGPKSRQDYESCLRELHVNQELFEQGLPRDSDNDFPGVSNVIAMLGSIDTKKDLWIIFEQGGGCLTKHLYEIKGEFWKGQRLYNVRHMPLYQLMRTDKRVLKHFLVDMLQVLDLLSHHKIVHSDLKPDNILLRFDPSSRDYDSLKIIDFGSAFMFEEITDAIGMATPEYLPPEVLEILIKYKHDGKEVIGSKLHANSTTWSFDMWSLGAIFLEIAAGFPLWMSYKGRVTGADGKNVFMTGLFAVNKRENEKILHKQYNTITRLREVLRSCAGLGLEEDDDAMDLMERMLAWVPLDRISPQEALAHPFLRS